MKSKLVKPAPVSTPAQKAQLKELEAIVSAGMHTFIEVGIALEKINVEKLYHAAGYEKFADYYREKWGYDKSYISRLISGARLGQAIRKKMPDVVLLESHVRALAPTVKEAKKGEDADLGPAIELVEKLTKGGKKVLTADQIKTVVSKDQRSRAVRAMDPQPLVAAFKTITIIANPQQASELLDLLRAALKDWTKTWPRLDRPEKFRGYDQPVRTAIAKLDLIDAWLKSQLAPPVGAVKSEARASK
jgi:hypothetical protein